MTNKEIEDLIESLKKPNFNVTINSTDLLSLLTEIKESRELLRLQAQYIENHLYKE